MDIAKGFIAPDDQSAQESPDSSGDSVDLAGADSGEQAGAHAIESRSADESKVARQSKFTPRWREVALELFAKGCTLTEVAAATFVTAKTIRNWLDRYPSFSKEVSDAQQIPIANVEAAVYAAACGYDYEEKKYQLNNDTGEMQLVETYVKHLPPNPYLAKFFLTNRSSGEWRDRQNLDMAGAGGSVDVKISIGDLSLR